MLQSLIPNADALSFRGERNKEKRFMETGPHTNILKEIPINLFTKNQQKIHMQ